ncbi:MAG: hypothetical protein ACE5JG_11420, partial [Planctomycetota bacterium]
EHRMTKVVYICHPFRGDIAANRERVRRICAAAKRDYVPLAPHLMLPAYIDEATERDLALEHGLALLRGADELWVCADDVSDGMAGEIAEARRLGVPVYRIDVEALLSRTGRLPVGSTPMGTPASCGVPNDAICGDPGPFDVIL